MNFRINLILDTEKRSTSIISAKGILRICAIVVPVIIIIILATSVLTVINLRHYRDQLVRENAEKADEKAKAAQLKQKLTDATRILEEVRGWKNARLNWHEQLLGIMQYTPTNVTLTKLTLSTQLKLVDNNKTPARIFSLELDGKAKGAGSDEILNNFQLAFKTKPPFGTNVIDIETVKLEGSEDLSEGASKDDRIFKLNCTYLPRRFK
jgi:hypothetical protein